MKVRVKWIENACFAGESESGHAIMMDGAADGGGRNLAPRPMETVLIGTGGCTAYDVVHILKKARAAVTDCVVEIDAARAAEDPKVFTRPWKISLPLYRRLERNAQFLEFKCVPFSEELMYGHLRKKTN